MKRIASLVLLLGALAPQLLAQAVTWEPAAPQTGQTLTIHYDLLQGPLPDDLESIVLHWGLYDPVGGGWSLPPAANWPEGSSSPDGFALQSPMPADGGVATVALPSIEPMEHIAFVFTDGGANWDNNGGANWTVDYVAAGTAVWWTPLEPETGDTVSIFYDLAAGELPAGPVLLHWGVNEEGHGNWAEPPAEIWPAGTQLTGDGHAARTPMVAQDGVWSVQIVAAAGIESLHFVFTNGSAWDTNGGANWDLWIGDPPVFAQVWHRFLLDTRSARFTGIRPVTQANLAGSMNGWNSSANPMVEGPAGVWTTDLVLQEGTHQYKFVTNGGEWNVDPDNPLNNPDDNNNSVLVLAPEAAPRGTGFSRPSGWTGDEAASFDLALGVRAPDGGEALVPDACTVTVDGAPAPHGWSGDSLTVSLAFDAPGQVHRALFTLVDEDGDAREVAWTGALAGAGWTALDDAGDDDGPGLYSYPTPFSGYADLRALRMSEAAGGDTLRVEVELGMVHDYSLVRLRLLPDLTADLSGDHISDELLTPDWAAGGVAVTLRKPGSPHLLPAQDNRLLHGHHPLVAGADVPVWISGTSLFADLPMDLLEDRLGSWQEDWFVSAVAEIDGVAPVSGGVFEPGPAVGGLDAAWDCDAYDALDADVAGLEDRLLGNSNLSRAAALDGVGRGFRAVRPEEVGPHMAAPGPVVRILTQGAPTILAGRTIRGTATANAVGDVALVRQAGEADPDTFVVPLAGGAWSQHVSLAEGVNHFQAFAVDGEGEWGASSSLDCELLRDHAPRTRAEATLQPDGSVRLYGGNTIDIDGDIVSWSWEAEAGNPAELVLTGASQQTASIPDPPAVDGAYWLQLTVVDAEGHEGVARALLEIENGAPRPLAANGYPNWVRDAIVYEIYVRSFDAQRTLAAVTARLDEIARLGVNTIWFMPVFEGPSDHGYAVSDYMAIESDYGTEDDLRELVEAAHDRGLRVVLDMIINHSSSDHPWFQNALEFGVDSPYRDWYMFNPDGSWQYYYDWQSLPNFNVSNADMKHFVFEMCRHWIEDVDVDGYRCDVAWGPQERDAQFWRDWRASIRTLKPDLFLLGEAGATDFTIFDNRFNLAYDWELFWQALQNLDTVSPSTLHDRVSNFGIWFPETALPFRFLENHDEARFIAEHGVEQAKLAAALLFSLPGVPLVYAGQEVGETTARGLIDWSDPLGLHSFYQLLCETRAAYKHFSGPRAERLDTSDPSQVYAIARLPQEGLAPADAGVVLAAYNLSGTARGTTLQLDREGWGMTDGTWYLTDLYTGETLQWDFGVPGELTVDLAAWEPRWWLLSDEPATVAVGNPVPGRALDFELGAPWPNPFNPSVQVELQVPAGREPVELAVYNLLGQRVAVLHEGVLPAGRHAFRWTAEAQASGVYLLQARRGTVAAQRKIVLLK